MTTLSTSPASPSFQTEGFSERLRGSVLAFVRSRVRDGHAAEDLTQEILIRASAKQGTVRHKEKLDSWLFGIARNAVADYFRKARPTERFNPDTHQPDDSAEAPASAEELALKQALTAYIRAVVNELPPLYREALELTEYQGISQVELARRAGISVSAAKSRVQRARAEVRRVIEDCCQFTIDSYGTVLECEPRKKDSCENC